MKSLVSLEELSQIPDRLRRHVLDTVKLVKVELTELQLILRQRFLLADCRGQVEESRAELVRSQAFLGDLK